MPVLFSDPKFIELAGRAQKLYKRMLKVDFKQKVSTKVRGIVAPPADTLKGIHSHIEQRRLVGSDSKGNDVGTGKRVPLIKRGTVSQIPQGSKWQDVVWLADVSDRNCMLYHDITEERVLLHF